MKKIFLAIPICFIMTIMTVLISCQKDGDVGPAGPAGNPGPAGPVGPAGPAGSANVIYSQWLNVAYNAVKGPGGDTLRFVANIPAAQLVDSILSRAEIKVYFNYRVPSNPDIVPLPYFDPIYFDPAVVINPDFVPAKIILSSNYNMGTFDENGEKRYQYRYIIIPGGTTAGRPAGEAKAIDWNNYKEVQAYLGLKD